MAGRSEMGATSGSVMRFLLLAALAAAPAAAIVNEMREVVKKSACMEVDFYRNFIGDRG